MSKKAMKKVGGQIGKRKNTNQANQWVAQPKKNQYIQQDKKIYILITNFRSATIKVVFLKTVFKIYN